MSYYYPAPTQWSPPVPEHAVYNYAQCQPQYPNYDSNSSNYAPAPQYTTSNVLRQNITHQQIQAPPVPVSSYSSLSGALDAAPSQHRSNSTRPAYPLSHFDAPRPARTPASPHASRTRRPSHPSTLPSSIPTPLGPTNHVLVPQRVYTDDSAARGYAYADAHFRHPSIEFRAAGIPEPGVRVGKITARYFPSIAGGQDAVFRGPGDREVRVWILWPGYGGEPMQRRMKTRGGEVDRDTVLMLLANMLLEFTDGIQKNKVEPEDGAVDWTIGRRADGKKGIVGEELFITRLVHRGGCNWQPEIWAPRRS